ncbi:MAG TPA: hypothetical protein VJS47_04450 [Rhizomicrobium sp.]|nr:hypothetical protein [Rhizomicrobium sp.]
MRTSVKAGIDTGMGEFRKITVQVPESLLEKAQAYTGEGVTQTVTAALKRLASIQAQQELLKLRGKVKFSVSYDEIKRERE